MTSNEFVGSLKIVTSVKTGVHKYLKRLDSRFRGNDKKRRIGTFYAFINLKNYAFY